VSISITIGLELSAFIARHIVVNRPITLGVMVLSLALAAPLVVLVLPLAELPLAVASKSEIYASASKLDLVLALALVVDLPPFAALVLGLAFALVPDSAFASDLT